MTSLYIAIIVLCIWIECDTKINTDNLLEKIGLGLIGTGAVVSFEQPNYILPAGVCLYLSSIALKRFINHRRAIDKRGNHETGMDYRG